MAIAYEDRSHQRTNQFEDLYAKFALSEAPVRVRRNPRIGMQSTSLALRADGATLARSYKPGEFAMVFSTLSFRVGRRRTALSRLDRLLASGALADPEAMNALQCGYLLDWLDPLERRGASDSEPGRAVGQDVAAERSGR